MEGVLSDGMCRCCASEGSFKDFQVPYQWMGAEEIYANMLKDCFDLTLSISEEINNGGICEVCITQLRNACNFKRQVQKTEEKFKRKMEESSFKTDSIKMEVTRFDDDDSNMSADEFSSQEYEVPIKVEKLDEKPRKRQAAAKASTSKAKKSKASAETSVKRVETEKSFIEISIKAEPISDTENEEQSITTNKLELVNQTTTTIKIEPMVNESIDEKKALNKKHKKEQKIAMEKHLKNISTILLNTNATPIRYHDGANYVCAMCPETYPLPSDLKAHVLEEHDEMDKSSFMEGHRLTSYVVRLDITHLCCLICHNEIVSFDDMFVHLNSVHKKDLHTDIPNHILPFRFVGNGFNCVQCPKTFEHFKLVAEHMSVHYQNYFCMTCNAPFVNKRTLQNHANRHKKGDFPCSQCPKIFDTNRKKLNHEKFVHVGDYKRKKCPYCQEKFTNYAKKRSHMAEEHGAEPLIVKCEICEEIFPTRARMRYHKRREHMECTYPCSECHLSFYTLVELEKHRLKHYTPAQEYICDICQKSYVRKHTLREHLKRHAKIARRFKCEHCTSHFSQKSSLKSHMQYKHNLTLV
ncbi:zinc finger protein 782 isoform X3 [Bicyclus anynana]|uniref:Zinc finger protein 782 isoform X3 n=1 Tax=Bicyclus anynana TaxID=110368 RepID=A0A6J1N4C9_BICAN|nr:zinc finger protein 782 isoform X3 [Bicyclus anynana]